MFLVHIVANHSWCLISLTFVLPCPMAVFSRWPLSGWQMIGLAQCSSMAFRSVTSLGPVAMFTPTRLPLRSLSIAAWIVHLSSICASHAPDVILVIGFWVPMREGFKIDALSVWSGEIWSVQQWPLLVAFEMVLLLQIQPLSEHGRPFFLHCHAHTCQGKPFFSCRDYTWIDMTSLEQTCGHWQCQVGREEGRDCVAEDGEYIE